MRIAMSKLTTRRKIGVRAFQTIDCATVLRLSFLYEEHDGQVWRQSIL